MSLIEQAAKIAQKAKHIMVLTGAGISVASGLPTYRGKDGWWTRKTQHKDPMRIATKAYFDMNPYECWQRSYVFFNMVLQGKPSVSHHALLKMQQTCLKTGIGFDLVTQNIDGYHADLIKKSGLFPNPEVPEGSDLFGHTEGVYEIHGNTHYMRCSLDGCSNTNLYKTPLVYNEYEPPRCPKCGNLMRRNTLLFDESYNERYYKAHSVLKRASESDLLLIMGTELKTSLPKRILYEHMDRSIDIVEFNLRTWVQGYNKVLTVDGECEKTIPSFVDIYLSLLNI